MSMLFGILSFGSQQVLPEWQGQMQRAARCWPSDRQGLKSVGSGFLGIQQRDNTPQSVASRQPVIEEDVAAIFDGRLDNRTELARELALQDDITTPDDAFVLAAYRKYGPGFAKYLLGDFSIALLDRRANTLLLVRDHMGVKPLFVARANGLVAFASSMAPLVRLPFVDCREDSLWIVDFLESVKVSPDDTPYLGIKSVPPATVMEFGTGVESHERFWRLPKPGELPVHDLTDEQAVARFSELFEQAVACRLPGIGDTASEFTAGLDSSAVVATAAPLMEQQGRGLHTFSHVLPEDTPSPAKQVGNERADIGDILTQYPGLRHHWITDEDTDQLTAMARTIRAHGGLQRRDLNSIGQQLPELMQRHDLRVLLSGFGGDQLVTSHGAGYPHSLAKEGAWDALRAFTEHEATTRARLRQAAFRTNFGRKSWGAAVRVLRAVEELTKARSSRFGKALSHGYPFRRAAFPSRPVAGSVEEREHTVITHPLISYRLQDSAVGAGSFGFEYRYPMLDIRLLEFCLSLPATVKRTAVMDRRMVRLAMAGKLPDKVRLRHRKAGSVPSAFVNHMRSINRFTELYRESFGNPLACSYVDLGRMVEESEQARRMGTFGKNVSKRQLMRAAELCLWTKYVEEEVGTSG